MPRTQPTLVARLTEPRLAAGALNAGRIAIGVTALVAPDLAARLLAHPEDRRPVMRMFARLAGIRDVALGAATLDALRRPEHARRLLWLGVACDATDAVATITQREIPRSSRYLTAAIALAGAAAGLLAASRTRR